MSGNTALIVGDIQRGIVDMILQEEDKKKVYLTALASTISAARKAGHKIVYVRVAFRKGYPDISPANKFFAGIRASGKFFETDPDTQIEDAVAPQEGDVVVVKRRVGAFLNTDLDLALRSAGVDKIVLTGLSTSGMILSSLRHAADLDYVITVLEDLCKDRDEEVHRVLTEKVFPMQATVESSSNWVGKL